MKLSEMRALLGLDVLHEKKSLSNEEHDIDNESKENEVFKETVMKEILNQTNRMKEVGGIFY
jgi:hypothetical protein